MAGARRGPKFPKDDSDTALLSPQDMSPGGATELRLRDKADKAADGATTNNNDVKPHAPFKSPLDNK